MLRIFKNSIIDLKEDLRQRKTLNKLQNVKSMKVKVDDIEIPSI